MGRHLSCAKAELLMKTNGRHDLTFLSSDLEQVEHPGFQISDIRSCLEFQLRFLTLVKYNGGDCEDCGVLTDCTCCNQRGDGNNSYFLPTALSGNGIPCKSAGF